MITLDEMHIKKKFAGFTLVELMIASTIATITLVVSFALIGNVYFARKQIRIAQNFYSESRFLLEKIVTISRENTIDYDRYFEEVGPNPTNCASFKDAQIAFAKTKNSDVDNNNNEANRKKLTYPNIFYWEISSDVYRNLGGMKPDGGIDPCTQAFVDTADTPLTELYLINKSRDIRTAIRLDDGDNTTTDTRIQTSVELGADTNNDGKADFWNFYYGWEDNGNGGTCYVYPDDNFTPSEKKLTLNQDEELCNSAHDWKNVSAKNLKVSSFDFTPYPDRDPYLNFRNDDVQVHPNIFLFMKVDLADFEKFGFETQPTITMQTSVSSRVYGNNRKN